MTAGRPTKYNPQFCETVIELGKQGKSIAQMACHLEVTRPSLYEWAKVHEEFSTAFTRAIDEMQAHLEDKGYRGLENRELNSAVWKKTMEARFRDDYTESKNFKHEGALNLFFDADDEDA